MKKSNGAITQNFGFYFALLPAIAILVAWSLGISALIQNKYEPAVPHWLIIISVAATLVGGMIAIGRLLRSSTGQRFSQGLLTCFLFPLAVIFMGGVYIWAADRFGRDSEQRATYILAVGLGVTVFGFGLATRMEGLNMVLILAGSLVGLIVTSLAVVKITRCVMRFGILHLLTVFVLMVVASIEDERRDFDSPGHYPDLKPVPNKTQHHKSDRAGGSEA